MKERDPELDAVYARAFQWCRAAGWLTSPQIDEAVEAGEAGLRSERIREQVRQEEAA